MDEQAYAHAVEAHRRRKDDAFHQYTFYVVTGDGATSGMVGAVWKDA